MQWQTSEGIELKEVSEHKWMIPKSGKMKVPAVVFASKKLLGQIRKDRTLAQLRNMTELPGIYKHAICLPDGHQGYGFPIGGVAALDFHNGGISPGGIGYDINCGVRMFRTNLRKEDVVPRINELINIIYNNVPSGVGVGGKLGRIPVNELNKVLDYGAKWALDKGYAWKEDLMCTEDNGSLEGDHNLVSRRAIERGRPQLGSLGAGNHFLEIQVIDKIYNPEVARAFGIESEGQVTGMIHCGSRGLGHQVCSDYLRMMERAQPEIVKSLPDRELIYAPAGSKMAGDYFKAMNAAANYAWTNRQLILHWVRESFESVFKKKAEDLGMHQIYDVCHNICKVEEHEVDGRKIKAFVHRKGATRAMPKGHPLVPKVYEGVGQPVLIPGTMGTASYLLVGGEESLKETFGSTAHGAGRIMSRHAAAKKYWGENIKKELMSKGIIVKARSMRGVSEESPGAYKDIDEVVRVSDALGIGRLVARVVPVGVIKG